MAVRTFGPARKSGSKIHPEELIIDDRVEDEISNSIGFDLLYSLAEAYSEEHEINLFPKKVIIRHIKSGDYNNGDDPTFAYVSRGVLTHLIDPKCKKKQSKLWVDWIHAHELAHIVQLRVPEIKRDIESKIKVRNEYVPLRFTGLSEEDKSKIRWSIKKIDWRTVIEDTDADLFAIKELGYRRPVKRYE